MQLRPRHRLTLLFLAVLAGFLSCREPTQITLVITTDAACPNGQPPRLIDITLGTGRTVDPRNFIEAAVSAACSDDSDGQSPVQNELGTLVLLPGDGDDKTVEIIVIAGVESQATNPNIQAIAKQQTSEQCKLLIQEGGLAAVGGTACIVARRRLSFIDHTRLVVPIDLDTRCIGKECDESSTCYQGNCVPITIECPPGGGDCSTPQSCEGQTCDDQCDSGLGECKDGKCGCLDCDDDKCHDSCALSGFVGECEDNQCLCRPGCVDEQCAADCNGTCSDDGSACVCDTCDEVLCGMFPCPGGGTGQCLPPDDTCACVDDDCVQGECEVLPLPCETGQLPTCITAGSQEACACACNDAECNSDCTAGGQCVDGACECNPTCTDRDCADFFVCDPGEEGVCDESTGGCSCDCLANLCSSYCAMSNQTGACNAADDCVCANNPVTTSSSSSGMMSGGGGTGGAGGTGGTGGVGGAGGTGGTGGVGGTGGCMGCPGGCSIGETCDVGTCSCQCDDGTCFAACGGSCDAGTDTCDCPNCFDGPCSSFCFMSGFPGGQCDGGDNCNCFQCNDDGDCSFMTACSFGFMAPTCVLGTGQCACACDIAACTTACAMSGGACDTGSCSCLLSTGGMGPGSCPVSPSTYADQPACQANCAFDCSATSCGNPQCFLNGSSFMWDCVCGAV